MNAETSKPPPFYCPACGKKHRADLSELQAHEGAIAKVPCHRCGIEMSLSIGSDGLPKCETRDPAGGAAGSQPPPAASLGASLGGTMSKSSGPLHLLAAVVVAAVVAFLTVTLTKGGGAGEPAAGTDDARVQALEQRLQKAEDAMQGLRATAERALEAGATYAKEMRSSTAAMKTGLETNSQSVSALEQLQTQMSKTFAKLNDAYKALNGRIEANYQKSRLLDKRLKALEEDGED